MSVGRSDSNELIADFFSVIELENILTGLVTSFGFEDGVPLDLNLIVTFEILDVEILDLTKLITDQFSVVVVTII